MQMQTFNNSGYNLELYCICRSRSISRNSILLKYNFQMIKPDIH